MTTFKFYSLSKFQLNTVLLTIVGFPGGASGKEPTAKAGALGDMGLIRGLGRSPGGGHGNPF